MPVIPREDGDIVISGIAFPIKRDPKTRRLKYSMAKPRVISQEFNAGGGISIVDQGPLKRRWVMTIPCHNRLYTPKMTSYGLTGKQIYGKIWDLYNTTASQTLNDRRTTILSVAIATTGSIATLTVGDATFLDVSGKIQIDDEVFAYSAKTPATGVLTISARAQDGTVAATHALNAIVVPRYSVRMMRFEEIEPLENEQRNDVGLTGVMDEVDVDIELQEI